MAHPSQRFLWGPGWEAYYVQFWSETEVINRIRAIAQRQQPIHLAAVAGAGEWHLIRAASHFFGSWRKAIEAGGYSYDDIRNDIKWTSDRVVREIRRLHRSRKDLSSREMQRRQPALFAGATRARTFGSWAKAVSASGLDYGQVRRYHRWDDARIRQGIEEIHRAGGRLNAGAVRQSHAHLYYAACHRFGSWDNTLRTLGHDPRKHALRRKWTQHEIVSRIRKLHREGVHLSDNNVRRHDTALYNAACRAFGCWTRARARAGIEAPVRKQSLGTAYLPGFEPPIAAAFNQETVRNLMVESELRSRTASAEGRAI